jgi:predicted Zn-dependent peptidase
MLNDELRVNSGLTYGASSRFNALKWRFICNQHVHSRKTEPAIDKALKSLISCKNGIDEKSLASAKLCKGQFPRYETTEQQASLLTQMFWYDFDKSL